MFQNEGNDLWIRNTILKKKKSSTVYSCIYMKTIHTGDFQLWKTSFIHFRWYKFFIKIVKNFPRQEKSMPIPNL